MADIKYYSCNIITSQGKVGHLPIDDNGYREIPLGAFDADNHHGVHYTFTTLVKRIFEDPNSPLNHSIKYGNLRGEWGHPQYDPATMSVPQYLARLRKIDQNRVSHHIKAVRLTEGKDHNGRKVIRVYGLVKASGVFADVLERMLSNPDENCAFSVRSFTNWSYRNGKEYKEIHDLRTWDAVNEGGFTSASKYFAEGLESLESGRMVDLNGVPFTEPDVALAELEGRRLIELGIESEAPDFTFMREANGWTKVQLVSPVSFLDI